MQGMDPDIQHLGDDMLKVPILQAYLDTFRIQQSPNYRLPTFPFTQ